MSIGTDWLRLGLMVKQQREEQARNDAARSKFQGLLGSAPETTTQPQAGPMMPDQERPDITAQVAGTGEGLLGGQMQLPEFYAQAAGIPGYEQMGMQGLLGIQKAKIDAASKNQFGGFKDLNEFLKAKDNIRNRANTQLAPFRESLRKFGQATDIVNKREGFKNMTGADDTILIKAFASMILPGEAVMEGDIGAIVNQSGIPGWLKSYIQKAKGEGQLAPDERARIYDAMTTLASRADQEYGDVRDMYNIDISQGGFDQSAIFRPKIPFEPFPTDGLLNPQPSGSQVTPPPGTVPYKG